jgi:hypothetical protein
MADSNAPQQVTTSAAAWEGKQASAWEEGFEGVPVAPTASTDATQTSRTAKTKDVDAASELSHQRCWCVSNRKLMVVPH